MTISKVHTVALAGFMMLGGSFLACGESGLEEGPVDFDSAGARVVRLRACSQEWEASARKGAGAEAFNASTLWSVSPYQVLVPATGTGYVKLNIDAPHYDWLVYLPSSVDLESVDGPELEYGGPVEECPELGLTEYGVHHTRLRSWLLEVKGAGTSRVRFYAGLAATDHSDPHDAGHAGHDLSGDENAPDHGH